MKDFYSLQIIQPQFNFKFDNLIIKLIHADWFTIINVPYADRMR